MPPPDHLPRPPIAYYLLDSYGAQPRASPVPRPPAQDELQSMRISLTALANSATRRARIAADAVRAARESLARTEYAYKLDEGEPVSRGKRGRVRDDRAASGAFRATAAVERRKDGSIGMPKVKRELSGAYRCSAGDPSLTHSPQHHPRRRVPPSTPGPARDSEHRPTSLHPPTAVSSSRNARSPTSPRRKPITPARRRRAKEVSPPTGRPLPRRVGPRRVGRTLIRRERLPFSSPSRVGSRSSLACPITARCVDRRAVVSSDSFACCCRLFLIAFFAEPIVPSSRLGDTTRTAPGHPDRLRLTRTATHQLFPPVLRRPVVRIPRPRSPANTGAAQTASETPKGR